MLSSTPENLTYSGMNVLFIARHYFRQFVGADLQKPLL
jgi:hypothetical protein